MDSPPPKRGRLDLVRQAVQAIADELGSVRLRKMSCSQLKANVLKRLKGQRTTKPEVKAAKAAVLAAMKLADKVKFPACSLDLTSILKSADGAPGAVFAGLEACARSFMDWPSNVEIAEHPLFHGIALPSSIPESEAPTWYRQQLFGLMAWEADKASSVKRSFPIYKMCAKEIAGGGKCILESMPPTSAQATGILLVDVTPDKGCRSGHFNNIVAPGSPYNGWGYKLFFERPGDRACGYMVPPGPLPVDLTPEIRKIAAAVALEVYGETAEWAKKVRIASTRLCGAKFEGGPHGPMVAIAAHATANPTKGHVSLDLEFTNKLVDRVRKTFGTHVVVGVDLNNRDGEDQQFIDGIRGAELHIFPEDLKADGVSDSKMRVKTAQPKKFGLPVFYNKCYLISTVAIPGLWFGGPPQDTPMPTILWPNLDHRPVVGGPFPFVNVGGALPASFREHTAAAAAAAPGGEENTTIGEFAVNPFFPVGNAADVRNARDALFKDPSAESAHAYKLALAGAARGTNRQAPLSEIVDAVKEYPCLQLAVKYTKFLTEEIISDKLGEHAHPPTVLDLVEFGLAGLELKVPRK